MAGPARLRMPAHLVERARILVTDGPGEWAPPPLRNAATVVVVTDAEDGLRVYLQRRVRTMAFAAGMYVFPGGAVDPEDQEQAEKLISEHPDRFADSTLAMPAEVSTGYDTLAARCAAVRETTEEAGYDLDDPMTLRYIAHWVTPEVEDRRFDTRFYAAAIDANTPLIENSGESDDHRWIHPQAALDDYAAGEMAMLPPTVAVLAAFAAQVEVGRSADESIEALASLPIVPLLPMPVADPDNASGVRWTLVDVRTREVVAVIGSAPAGSESAGIDSSKPQNSRSSADE